MIKLIIILTMIAMDGTLGVTERKQEVFSCPVINYKIVKCVRETY